MVLSRQEAVAKLLDSFQTYYNVNLHNEPDSPLKAVCEYYEKSESYMVSKKVNLWTAKSEEFIYLFEIPHLTVAGFQQYKQYAYDEGMKLAHIGSGHMYTNIAPIFVCDSAEPDAIKALKKCRVHKLFKFSFHGWLDVNCGLYMADSGDLVHNSSGKSMVKELKKVLVEKT